MAHLLINRAAQSDSELSEIVDVGGNEDDEENEATSSSSSDSSTSSEDESQQQQDSGIPSDMTLELAQFSKDALLSLPRGLCENAAIFKEFFSRETWSYLPEHMRAQLYEFLPRFSHLLPPAQAQAEQQRSIASLFDGSLQRFGKDPLTTIQKHLEMGNYRPDVRELRESIAKSRRREQRFQNCERLSHLAKQLFVSRERLLRQAYNAPPDAVLRSTRSTQQQASLAQYADNKLCAVKARKRYKDEVQQLAKQLGLGNQQFSADEDDDDMLDVDELKESRSIAELDVVKPTNDKFIYGTMFKRRLDMDDEDALKAQQRAKQPRLNNRNFRQYLLEHKRRKIQEPVSI